MTHQDALQQMAVEQYILGELTGDARDGFEEHLFDCTACAADLNQGLLFLDAARLEMKQAKKAAPSQPVRRSTSPLAWLLKPSFLAPALAACLAVIVFQSAIVLPRLAHKTDTELAASQTPSVLEPLVLANAGARGGSIPELTAPRHGVYLLSVDIPPTTGASSYRCSLVSPTGTLLWHVEISPRQAHDAVTIQVPVTTAVEGVNELRVQGVESSSSAGVTLVDLTTYRYRLNLAQ